MVSCKLVEARKSSQNVRTNSPHKTRLVSRRRWMGADFFALLEQLSKNRFRIHPSRLADCLIDLCFSLFNTGMGAMQTIVLGPWVEQVKLEGDPLFIIGHWRTGTTLLHELLALDCRHRCPTTFECFCPTHFLITEGLMKFWSGFVLPPHRPPDNMEMGWDYPRRTSLPFAIWGSPAPTGASPFPTSRQTSPTVASWTALGQPGGDAGSGCSGTFLQAVTYKRRGRMC